MKISATSESDGYETISYAAICNDLSEVIKGGKLPLELKRAVQAEITQIVRRSVHIMKWWMS